MGPTAGHGLSLRHSPLRKSQRNAVSKYTFHHSYEMMVHWSFNGHMWVLRQMGLNVWYKMMDITSKHPCKCCKGQICHKSNTQWVVLCFLLYMLFVQLDICISSVQVQCETKRVIQECCDTREVTRWSLIEVAWYGTFKIAGLSRKRELDLRKGEAERIQFLLILVSYIDVFCISFHSCGMWLRLISACNIEGSGNTM